jgi:hypothetical protein
MPQDTATVVGPGGSSVKVEITSGTIQAVAWTAPVPAGSPPPTVAGQVITIPSLPKGDSTVRVDIMWAPGDGDAEVHYPPGPSYGVVDYIYRHSQAGCVYLLLLFGV